MVGNKVKVYSRSAVPDAKGYLWESDGYVLCRILFRSHNLYLFYPLYTTDLGHTALQRRITWIVEPKSPWS